MQLKFLLIVGILACLPAYANDQLEDCRETAMTQTDMNFCALADAKKANAQLSEVYRKLMAKLGPESQNKLREAEKAWIAYRNKECEFETFGTIDGSVHPMIVSGCYANLAAQQTKNLQDQLDCQEGDLSCVRQ